MTTQGIKQVLYIYRDRDKTGRTLQRLCTKDKQIKLLSLRSIPSSLPLHRLRYSPLLSPMICYLIE